MKYSLKKQMAFLFIGLIVCLLVGNWIINNVFLESYYVHKKKNMLINAYEEINKVEDRDGYFEADFWNKVYEITDVDNIVLVLLDGDFEPVYPLVDEGEELLSARLIGYMLGVDDSKVKIIEKNNKYTVQKIMDSRRSTDYLEIWGTLDTNCFFAMRIPIEGIRGNVKISNQFLSYFSIAGLFISIVLVLWISKRITDPIQKLTILTQRMKDLDFEVKYDSKGNNEIDLLGENFNSMSETLKKTVSELKTANNELQKDIEKKEEIDEMRKEFLANVSHELKTPIALIQGYAEGLQEGINDDQESRDFYCEVIMDEASKMNQMVKKLLTLNQLEFGNDTVTMELFDINDLIKGIIQSAGILAEQKEIKIIYGGDDPIYVWGDEFKLEEVITNYLSNAINHADNEKVIDIKVRQAGGKVRVSVFNTGKPIPEEDIDNIWIKFYKVDKARTREYGGSGIGLSIVKAIMDSMNQKFGVINYDNGVEFWFELEGKAE